MINGICVTSKCQKSLISGFFKIKVSVVKGLNLSEP